MLAACDAAGIALVPLVAPTTPDDRLAAIGARARGFLYTVSVTGTTGERSGRCRRRADADRARQGLDRPRRSRSASASRRPSRPRAAADAGADGVIVGSRLVRAAAEAADAGEDPAAAVGARRRALAAGLVR